jgi:hypothetical protein
VADDTATPAPAAAAPIAQAPQTLVDAVAAPAAAAVVDPAPVDPAVPGYLGGKYKTDKELEAGYKELQGKFTEATTRLKGFAGAPEAYELSMPDDLKGAVEWNAEDPLMVEFTSFAKEAGMSQEAFSKALHMLARYEYTMETVDLQQEKAALGDRADERIKGFTDWAQANLGEAEYAEVLSTLGQRTSPSKVFRAMELVLQANKQPAMPKPGDDVQPALTLAEVEKMQFAKNEHGQRLMEVDPAYAAKVRAARASIVGTGDTSRVVNFSR